MEGTKPHISKVFAGHPVIFGGGHSYLQQINQQKNKEELKKKKIWKKI